MKSVSGTTGNSHIHQERTQVVQPCVSLLIASATCSKIATATAGAASHRVSISTSWRALSVKLR